MITILGTTASGKTHLAVHLADTINGEIISADSRQVYKEMSIGTGKDLDEYFVNGKKVPYYLIDIHNAGYEYNVFEFQKDFIAAYNQIQQQNHIPILCGGTGLYLEAVLKQYKLQNVPVNETLRTELSEKSIHELSTILASYIPLHNQTDTCERERLLRAIEIQKFQSENKTAFFPEIKNTVIGIFYERDTLRQRITTRLQQRLQSGMIEEVQTLLNKGISEERLLCYGLEYKYVTLFLNNTLSYDEMFRLLNIAIHQFAKRQMTWYRRMEKTGTYIHWIDGNLSTQQKIKQILDLEN